MFLLQIGENDYTVKASQGDTVYSVNTELGTCLCPVGRAGAPCKHQAAVASKFGIPSFNFLPVKSAETRKIFLVIATGSSIEQMGDSWFQPLKSGLFQGGIDTNADDSPDVGAIADATDDSPGVGAVADATDDAPGLPLSEQTGNDDQHTNDVPDDGSSGQHHSSLDMSETISSEPNLLAELGKVFDGMTDKLNSSPEEFGKAVTAFIGNYKKITTDSHLVSALHMFGKNVVTSKTKSRASFHSSSKIGVQPTAVSRRKMAMGGKRRVSSGRPSKASFVAEHGYGKRKATPSLQCMPKKRSVAPHSLTHCVAENVALGKTHAAK